MKKIITLVIISGVIGGVHRAISSAEKERPSITQSVTSKEANSYFWDNFHAGNYDSISQIIKKLNIALNENPNDLVSTEHLGFVHIWALSERQRLSSPDPSIAENLHLARQYFEKACKMDETDPRILGFFADMLLDEGFRLNNTKEQTEGLVTGLKAVKQWPQFNKFTIGYAFSALPPGDKNFKLGLKWQYESMNDCACNASNVNTLSNQEKTEAIKSCNSEKIKRACGNSWIAPHNLEGFFLNMGDMLVKNGQWEEGIKIYKLAKISDTYDKWIYKNVLEDRITNARENTAAFNKPLNEIDLKNQKVMMINSRFSCMSCHQMSKDEQALFGKDEPPLNFTFFKATLKQ